MSKNLGLMFGTLALVMSIISMFLSLKSEPLAFVELNEVYSECTYAKGLMAEHRRNNKTILIERDSLSKLFKSLINDKDQYQDTAGIVSYYLKALDDRIGSLNSVLDSDKERINEKVWNFINREILEFGKSNKYHLIMGATGDGGIMYGEASLNVTEDFIDYLNKGIAKE